MNVKGNGGSGFQNPEPGSYSAVCTRIIDLGTQTKRYKEDVKQVHQVLIAWELEAKMKDGRPFLASSRFTASIHKKATLGKFLEGWRGKAFTDEERNGFDLKTILGAPCLLTLVQNGEYVNVTNASKLPASMARIEPVAPLVLFDLSKFDKAIYESFSDGLKATIAKSPEYDKATGGEGFGSPPPANDDDIPF